MTIQSWGTNYMQKNCNPFEKSSSPAKIERFFCRCVESSVFYVVLYNTIYKFPDFFFQT